MYVKQDQVFPNVTLTLPGRLVKLSVPAQWNSCNIIASTLSYLSPRTQGCGHLLNFSSTRERRGAEDTRDEGAPSSSATDFFTKEEDSESDFTIRISHKNNTTPLNPPPPPPPPYTTTHTFYQPQSAKKKKDINNILTSNKPSIIRPINVISAERFHWSLVAPCIFGARAASFLYVLGHLRALPRHFGLIL